MKKNILEKFIVGIVSLTILFGFALLPGFTPKASAATRVRPVTVSGVSQCVNYKWVIYLTVKSTTNRVVNVYETNDQYTNNEVADALSLTANTPAQVTVNVSASAQKEELGVFSQGSLGWDYTDPLASIMFFDPIQTNPYSTC